MMRLQAHSPTPQHLFEEIARQLFSQLMDPAAIGEALREKVAVEGESLEDLLRQWITTLLDLVRMQHMVFRTFKIDLKIDEKSPYSLKAEVIGELLDPQRHEFIQDPAWLKCTEVLIRKDQKEYHAEILLNV
jgi:SHS2 domain-containing protein